MPPRTWLALIAPARPPGAVIPDFVFIPYLLTFVPCAFVALIAWFAGAIWLVWRRAMPWIDAFVAWGWYGWIWWCVLDVWEWLRIVAVATGSKNVDYLLNMTPQFWLAGCLACWLTTLLIIGLSTDSAKLRESKALKIGWMWLACGFYIVVFTTMNWRLYFNLLVPHGDSVMYEEHLWNVLHGKGFLSYLDQGYFLGEHIQFVHLFLIPLYIIWPSHLLLEACSSVALALGAFPVFWMVRRHTASDRTAFAAGVAYLLYFPMQFLDIEIDLKTFRPESFGIPLLLLTLDQLDRRHLMGALIGSPVV